MREISFAPRQNGQIGHGLQFFVLTKRLNYRFKIFVFVYRPMDSINGFSGLKRKRSISEFTRYNACSCSNGIWTKAYRADRMEK